MVALSRPEQPSGSIVQLTFSDHLDTLRYNGYLIIRTDDSLDSSDHEYSVIILKNDRIVWRLEESVSQRQNNIAGLIPLLGNRSQQLFVEQFSGGAHCCWSVWLLDLRDSIHVLYCGADYPELGGEPDLVDFDNDGSREIAQEITLFHYFDMISYAGSPHPTAFFKYSEKADKFVLANRSFSQLPLKDADKRISELKQLSAAVNRSRNSDATEDLKSTMLALVLDYVYSGQGDKGWALFDRYYVLTDKVAFKTKVQDALEKSRVYRELYRRGGGN
jgi:hypothetical protein